MKPGNEANLLAASRSSRATHVPVGEDQLQHLELSRDIAKAFNSSYGAAIPLPLPLLSELVWVHPYPIAVPAVIHSALCQKSLDLPCD